MSQSSFLSTGKKPSLPPPINRWCSEVQKATINADFPKMRTNDKPIVAKKPIGSFTIADKIKKQLEEDAIAEAARKAEATRAARLADRNRANIANIPSRNNHHNHIHSEYDVGCNIGYGADTFGLEFSTNDLDDLDYVAPHLVDKHKKSVSFIGTYDDNGNYGYFDEDENECYDDESDDYYLH